jgi:hypothetical protein
LDLKREQLEGKTPTEIQREALRQGAQGF